MGVFFPKKGEADKQGEAPKNKVGQRFRAKFGEALALCPETAPGPGFVRLWNTSSKGGG